MITTRDSIKYQFSLIFGYSSPKDLVVGDIIGPRKLTRKLISSLSNDVINYFRLFNTILQDYTGSELYGIEFELVNVDVEKSRTKILPKSMIFVPGKFKECESLLLALKPEIGFLDFHKSRKSLDEISENFYEIEEFIMRPELSHDDSLNLLKNFASRFSKKLFSELYEDKWSKKLKGIKTTTSLDNSNLTKLIKIKTDVNIRWNGGSYEIQFLNPSFENLSKNPGIILNKIHLIYLISETSAYHIVDKCLKLGTDLIKLANLSTIDEMMDEILTIIIQVIFQELSSQLKPYSSIQIINYLKTLMENLKARVNLFIKNALSFTSSGESGNLNFLLEMLESHVKKEYPHLEEFEKNLLKTLIKTIKRTIKMSERVRAIELQSPINYFTEGIRLCFKFIQEAIHTYLSRRLLRRLLSELINKLMGQFDKEASPARTLGKRLLIDFKKSLINKIELNPSLWTERKNYDENLIKKQFIKLVKQNLDQFFQDIQLNLADIIDFVTIQMQSDSEVIKEHLDKFKKFQGELNFLITYILRYNTINRFIKNLLKEQINSPTTFADLFYRFLEKRVGGIDLEWKSYVLSWILDYKDAHSKDLNQKEWNIDEIIKDFLNYLQERKKREQDINYFMKFLDFYIPKHINDSNRESFLEFYKFFESSIRIKEDFPRYVRNKIELELNLLDVPNETLSGVEFLKFEGEDTFYNFIKENHLKYFSHLIPRPVSIILKHRIPPEERDLLRNDLFHIINIKYWAKKSLIEVFDNFKEVYNIWLENP